MKEVGTLKDLDVKPGDVVVKNGQFFDIVDTKVDNSHPRAKFCDGKIAALSMDNRDHQQVNTSVDPSWRIVSRASDKPKLWRDMTPEEKGALLLAAHEGKVIECFLDGEWFDCDGGVSLMSGYAYRVRPEPNVETVMLSVINNQNGWQAYCNLVKVKPTHRITFNLIDGKPDLASIKMEEL